MSSRLLRASTEGWRHLVRHPLRSALTALTCAVAIGVTVNVISLAYGMDADIRRDLARFGRLTIDVGRTPLIRPGMPRAPFGVEDVEKVAAAVKGLDAVIVPLRTERATAKGDAELSPAVLAAVTVDYPRTLTIDLAAGRWFTAAERGLSACVLDESAARSLFPSLPVSKVVGKTVHVEIAGGHDVPVVGVLADPMTYRALFETFDEGRVSRTLVSAVLSFRNVYVPDDALPSSELTLVHVVLPDERRLDLARARLERMWQSAADNFDDLDPTKTSPVSVFTRKTWIDAFGGVTQTTAFVGNFIWILICLVACVMISTLHLLTIRERYDELAVRRCEGARRSDIVAQVAAEGVVTSLVGGVLGLPLGYLASDVLKSIVDIPFRFEPRYAAPALGVAIVLGLISSALPARRAASLDPAAVLSRRLS